MLTTMFHHKFTQSDWLPAALIGLVALLSALAGLPDPLERALYDGGVRLAAATPATDQVAVINIDEASLARLGDWPWPRNLLADMIERLNDAEPALIALTMPLHQPQYLPARRQMEELLRFYEGSGLVNQLYCQATLEPPLQDEVTVLGAKLRSLQNSLNTDRRLAESLRRAGNVLIGAPVMPAPGLDSLFPAQALPLDAASAALPLPELAAAATGVGVLPVGYHDSDGVTRRAPLAVNYQGQTWYALAWQIAAHLQGGQPSQAQIASHGLHLGGRFIPTDAALNVHPRFYAGQSFSQDSFAEVYSGQVAVEKFRGKAVLIGLDSARFATPVGEMSAALLLAHTATGLLQGESIVAPAWSGWLQAALFLIILIWLARTDNSDGRGLFPTIGLALALPLLSLALLAVYALWLPTLTPALLLLLGQPAMNGWRAWQAHQQQKFISSQDAENNRLLGLALQSQGRLEMAFEKFKQCPPDELVLSLLYNLGLDFERKRQPRQAAQVYRHIQEYAAEFRDVRQRVEQLGKAQAPVPTAGNLATLFDDEGELQKPVLGRYQIEKKLGKGAMGVVYLGSDPKLDRMVALKTLNLSQEFEGEELQEATTRFFHEAAAAGRLKHPNIISVYDAGEQYDLAYISMEYFKGGDLLPYTRKERLLPLETLIELGIKAAEALDYAHNQGVVHRDIKPANILYNPANSQIKLTDFGIAHIIDSKKTKTGIILGTPSYMSPEQLAGKRLDGRSDLFSLGVTLYQLLSGELPFRADSMASLMFKIASDEHPDILEYRPDLPLCLKAIVDKLLRKQAAQRYQSGKQLAVALRECGSRINAD
jgi:serine/threonine-protein kinase